MYFYLSTAGQVFTWGGDSRGQLGAGQRKRCTDHPQRLRSLSLIPLVQIAAGGEQSFALSASGAVIGWGRNDCGQLGLGHRTGKNKLERKNQVYNKSYDKLHIEIHFCRI